MVTDNLDIHIRQCPVCKKEFYANADHWAYINFIGKKRHVFCSWSCMRKFERERGTKASRQPKIIKALEDGLTVNEISNMLNVDRATVLYWKKKMEAEQQ